MFGNKRTMWWRLFLVCAFAGAGLRAQVDDFEDEYADEVEVPDPLEPMNRGIYHFNDKLYFWVLRPLAKGYGAVLPKPVRQGVRNVFDNASMPGRFVNCVLQGRLRDSGGELARFGINTTVGILGWRDSALDKWEIKRHGEDTGQTLGAWGIGPGLSLTLPLIGPTNARDSVGLVGDVFLDPVRYIPQYWTRLGINAGKQVNRVSLSLGEYEKSKAAALDHYVSLRDIYQQYRERKIAE